jgi:hypothetical protein
MRSLAAHRAGTILTRFGTNVRLDQSFGTASASSVFGCDSRRLWLPRRARFDPFSPSVGSGRVGALQNLSQWPKKTNSRFGMSAGHFPARWTPWVEETVQPGASVAGALRAVRSHWDPTGGRMGPRKRRFAPSRKRCGQPMCSSWRPGSTCTSTRVTSAPVGTWGVPGLGNVEATAHARGILRSWVHRTQRASGDVTGRARGRAAPTVRFVEAPFGHRCDRHRRRAGAQGHLPTHQYRAGDHGRGPRSSPRRREQAPGRSRP